MSICRICDSSLSTVYLDLGRTPLANSYVKTEAEGRSAATYELAVALCDNCHLSQLTTVVPPELMFDHYLYVSSTTQTFRKHCEGLVASVFARRPDIARGDLALDIASNDGCLLSYFQLRGCRILGVDPARNLVSDAIARGIDTIGGYWGEEALDQVLKRAGRAKVVTATNVLAHVDRIHDFLANVWRVLDDDGLFVCEVPYLVDLIDNVEFDTIYHEHVSYFLIEPLRRALEANRLMMIDVEHQSIHGGTIRVYAMKTETSAALPYHVQRMIESERARGFHDAVLYRGFAATVRQNRTDMRATLSEFKSQGKRISGYGASAKGNTLLNYYGIDSSMIDYIVDDNPKKHGYLTPGSLIPIVTPDAVTSSPPDYLLLLAWNFASEIKSRTSAYRERGGKYIVPVPRCVCES